MCVPRAIYFALPARAAVVQHELPRGFLRNLVAIIIRDHGEREVDAGGDAGRSPDVVVANIDLVGLELDLRIGRNKMFGALPMRGGAASVEQAGFGQHIGAGANTGDADAAFCNAPHE